MQSPAALAALQARLLVAVLLHCPYGRLLHPLRATTPLTPLPCADCITCNSVLGWKYEVAYEESQKYKEGKFILEKVGIGRGACMWRGGGRTCAGTWAGRGHSFM